MKRARELDEEEEQQTEDLVSCLMLLSNVDRTHRSHSSSIRKPTSSGRRVFACKTCNREFSSFQALGGHRASHKKRKLDVDGAVDLLQPGQLSSPKKPKKHECPICGVEFAVGQALGGHMRRHRDVMSSAEERIRAAAVPVLKKSNSSKRISCLNLDLNLAPPGYYLIS